MLSTRGKVDSRNFATLAAGMLTAKAASGNTAQDNTQPAQDAHLTRSPSFCESPWLWLRLAPACTESCCALLPWCIS